MIWTSPDTCLGGEYLGSDVYFSFVITFIASGVNKIIEFIVSSFQKLARGKGKTVDGIKETGGQLPRSDSTS